MNELQPIFTLTAECQDCYKCLRQCRVKAIQITDGHARVVPELCINCGDCVRVCPVGAKKVRDDMQRAKLLLRMKKTVYASVAPSFVNEFKGLDYRKLVKALKLLGFAEVSETALGAQQVSTATGRLLRNAEKKLYISTACPVVVEMIFKYYPELADCLCDLVSPVLAHARMLKQKNKDSAVVFFGPCIAKKTEADDRKDALDVVLTFKELKKWFIEQGIDLCRLDSSPQQDFFPQRADKGSLYPIDGGMISGIKESAENADVEYMVFSGTKAIQDALEDIKKIDLNKPVFLELLACEGGCVNGPAAYTQTSTAMKRFDIIEYAPARPDCPVEVNKDDLSSDFKIQPVKKHTFTEEQIREALKGVGKFGLEDELNCGSCGYESCRNFATALLTGHAERSMCMGYMRQLARKQADALLRAMPSGVVITNEKLKIIESNRKFAELMGPETVKIYEQIPHLEGASLNKVVPFHELFQRVLKKGLPKLEKDIRFGSTILHLTVFTIEKHRMVGGIVQDITAPAVHKERIIKQAKEVIERNLSTVQKIAYLLGENAAESESILNSIVESFLPESVEDEYQYEN